MPGAVFISTTSFGRYETGPLDALKRSALQPVLNPLGRTLKPEEISHYAGQCVGIIAGTEPYSQATFARLPHLKVISRCGVGMDGIDLAAAAQRGIAVVSTPDGPTSAVAELTVGLLVNLIRQVDAAHVRLTRGVWEKSMGFLVSELTIGLFGFGRIGKRVAAILRAFEATVIGCDLNPDRAWAAKHGVGLKTWEELLKASDVLSLHVPYGLELHHVIGARELAMMKSGSYLINTSRGGLIDEEALYQALTSGRLRGAALDTFEQEPYTGPLRELDNVILTPHIGSYARAARVQMERQAVENLLDALQRLKVLDGPVEAVEVDGG